MPPRKVKVVSLGTEPTQTETQPPKSTLVVLNDKEFIEQRPDPPASPPPPSPEPEEKPLLDSEEIDAMLDEVRNNKDALIMAGVMTMKHQDKQAVRRSASTAARY